MEMYFSPPSGAIAKTFFPFPNSLATLTAVKIEAPEEIPTKTPSFSANIFVNLNASSSDTVFISSTTLGS